MGVGDFQKILRVSLVLKCVEESFRKYTMMGDDCVCEIIHMTKKYFLSMTTSSPFFHVLFNTTSSQIRKSLSIPLFPSNNNIIEYIDNHEQAVIFRQVFLKWSFSSFHDNIKEEQT